MNAAQTKFLLKNMPTNKSIMLSAKHGVGKSSVVKQAAKELGIACHDVRLSQLPDVGDLKGLPFLNAAERRTEFLKPYWWPRDPDSSGILFFDEMNRANKDVLQAVFEICLDRRLDGEALPKGWRVVAAINASDDYDVVELDPAMLDRWFVIDFDPSLKEWLSWGAQTNMHPSILDFISQNPGLLDPPVGAMVTGKIYPSRRSWESFDETCKALNLYDSKDDVTLTQVCNSWLGESVGVIFPKFLSNDFSRLKAEDVIKKFDEISFKIESACSDIESIGSLADSVTKLLEQNPDMMSNQEYANNLKKFLLILPKDVASSFWQSMLNIKAIKKFIQSWINDEQVRNFMSSVYIINK